MKDPILFYIITILSLVSAYCITDYSVDFLNPDQCEGSIDPIIQPSIKHIMEPAMNDFMKCIRNQIIGGYTFNLSQSCYNVEIVPIKNSKRYEIQIYGLENVFHVTDISYFYCYINIIKAQLMISAFAIFPFGGFMIFVAFLLL